MTSLEWFLAGVLALMVVFVAAEVFDVVRREQERRRARPPKKDAESKPPDDVEFEIGELPSDPLAEAEADAEASARWSRS